MSGLQGHTPGPWKAGKYCVWGGHNGDTYVAGTQTGIDADEQAANARLIASAPDMRAALDAKGARIAELEKLVTSLSAALEAISGMEVTATTDHRQLTALVLAIAKQALAGAI